MPTNFDTQWSQGAFVPLARLHGETIKYQPLHRSERDVVALVDRRGLEPLDALVGAIAPRIVVEVLDDRDNEEFGGIEPLEANAGGDCFLLAWHQGGQLESRPVNKRLPSDGGVVRLEIR